MKQLVVFTDLDGTMLAADTYSFAGARPALRLLKEKEIPLVICSSKTKREIEYYRRKLDNGHPFASENGGGIFIPTAYFDLSAHGARLTITSKEGYQVIRLGAEYSDLRKALKELQAEGFQIRGFGDMESEEIAVITGMTVEDAEMAKERDFDEPFIVTENRPPMQELIDAIHAKGFHWTEGKFLHLLGDSNKGKAVSVLIDFYREKFGAVKTVAVGDGPNDIPMLERVDYPVVVQGRDGSYDPRITLPNIVRASGIGPEGWNRAIIELLESLHL